jgi:hypothetical protein
MPESASYSVGAGKDGSSCLDLDWVGLELYHKAYPLERLIPIGVIYVGLEM